MRRGLPLLALLNLAGCLFGGSTVRADVDDSARRYLQDWRAEFPQANAVEDSVGGHLSYVFYFKNQDMDLCVILDSAISPKVQKARDPANEMAFQGSLSATSVKLYIRCKGRTEGFDLRYGSSEYLELLGTLATHEIFRGVGDPSPEIEPEPMFLDGYIIVCVRNFGGEKTVVERQDGASVAVDHWVSILYDEVSRKVAELPDSDQRRLFFVLDQRAKYIPKSERKTVAP